MRKLTSLLGNSQRLDGGAMFGNVPKPMWSQWVEVDADNRIALSCRALLVEDKGKRILFETGIGAFFEPKLKERFGVVETEHVLLNSLAAVGLTDKDIDVVVLSHLHFDHAGGLLTQWQENKSAELLFPNAHFIIGQLAWERANQPHARDRASFIVDLPGLLETTGRVELVTEHHSPTLGADYYFHYSEGHTPGLILTEIQMPGGPVVFAGDLIPGTAWVHLPVTMGYDRYPEKVIDEKKTLLEALVKKNGCLFYTHDHKTALSKVVQDEKGRFMATDCLASLRDWTGTT